MTILLAALAAGGCRPGGNGSGSWLRPPDTAARPAKTSQEGHFSILLSVHHDPVYHARHANDYKKALTEKVGWRGLFVIHKAGHSEVYWGRYPSPEKAKPNLKTAKSYRTANGIALFAQAIIVPTPGKDVGPREWDLKNAPGYYSLLVAMFTDVPDRGYVGRRRFAVDYCRQLRKNGYHAYFDHGPTVSHVTIGSFGEKALTIKKSPRGETMKINDPAIKSLQRDFPILALNGRSVDRVVLDPRTGKRVSLPSRKTYLVRVPGKGRPEDRRPGMERARAIVLPP